MRFVQRTLRKGGVELTAPFTLNTFRKSFAQNHADVGTPPRTLAKLLGHSTVQTTMDFYARVTDANERAAAATSDQFFVADFHRTFTGGSSEDVAQLGQCS